MKLTKLGKKLLCYFLLVSIVPISITGTIVYKYLHDQTKDEAFRALESTANTIKSHLDLLLQKKRCRVVDFSSDGLIRDYTGQLITQPENTSEIRRALNNHLLTNKLSLDPDIISISILDPVGQIIASTSQELIGNNESQKNYFRFPYLSAETSGFFFADALPESGTESISDLIFSSMLTDRIVHNPLGIIAMKVKGTILENIIDTQRHYTQYEQKENHSAHFSNVYILSNASTIIAKLKTNDNRSHRKSIDPEALRRVSGLGKNYSGSYVNPYGITVLGTLLFVPETQWTIVTEKNLEEAFLPLTRLKYIFGIAGSVVVFLILSGTTVIFSHLSADIRKLLIGIKKVAHGNLTQPITIGKRNDEIQEVVVEFNSMVKQLRISNESNAALRSLDRLKDNIIKDVSHELKSPLSQLRLALELWLDRQVYNGTDRRKANHKNDHFISIIKVNIGRLNKTIESVLTLADLESGTEKYDKEPINIGELILQVTAGLRLIAENQDLSIKTDIADHLPEFLGDRMKIMRVVSNLIDNAIKYTKAGTIIVSAKNRYDEIEVSVKDTGVGISLPKHLQGKIFDRFYQEKKIKSEGVGLGLAICNTIIKAHGGRIWFESSRTGKGTTFKFALPKPSLDDYHECMCSPQ
ncbi:MAG: sensor histidine kinase [Candidatus Scalindua sp.]|nr:sensor histidine kinase [Candidatus Scalindua sp.]